MKAEKYSRGYFMPPFECNNWVKKEFIDKPPIWCSVDLRDGNQALVVPMSLEEKLEFFTFLCKLGFKQIEIGFPAASETEHEFCRALIENNLIPDDVAVQVLTMARKDIIEKTFNALRGCKNAIIHLYNSTSKAQREQVFKKSEKEIIELAKFGATLCKEYAQKTEGNFTFEYSPESFTGTEMEFATEICNAVLDIWQPTAENKAIINLPVTVELSMPHVYASQVEYMCKSLKYRENVIVSLHPHNDRGCAVADCELGLLAGGDRIEGTLFGNGERTGNADIVTLALNMYSHGVDPQIDFSNMPAIIEEYEKVTRMHVNERQPYGGRLVFAAFSGSHQDAIAKGMKFRESEKSDKWNVPYLPIDPTDLGREYEADVIRINSQSGKGGIGYIIEMQYGFNMPKEMRGGFGSMIKSVSDHAHKELQPSEVFKIFQESYVNITTPLNITEHHFKQGEKITATVSLDFKDKHYLIDGIGNGRLDAVSNAIKEVIEDNYTIVVYQEHALTKASDSQAAAYVCVNDGKGDYWGVGVDYDIINASVKALISAVNNMLNK